LEPVLEVAGTGAGAQQLTSQDLAPDAKSPSAPPRRGLLGRLFGGEKQQQQQHQEQPDTRAELDTLVFWEE
jgi:hypothetical protein